jgi:phosphatidylinositol-3-phosphatase
VEGAGRSGRAVQVTLLLKYVVVLGVALVGLSGPHSAMAEGTPHIKHVFIIVLENENQDVTFGPAAPAPYLAKDLVKAGAYVPNYFGVAHLSNPNYLAMISGQPPNIETQADCQFFTEMMPGTLDSNGIATGQGCVFPSGVTTVANQLQGGGYAWRGYMQDMATPCSHPAIGARDGTQSATASSQYATRHNPFVYFHSIIDQPICNQNVVNLDQLKSDLSKQSTTPNYSFIVPDLCADGHDATCADPSQPGGFDGINAFLKEWVPRIQKSAAYQDHGAIIVTFDESESGAESCCDEPQSPNTPNNGATSGGMGGGQTGAVIVSPCTRGSTVTQQAYNHYSLLRWVEDNFGLQHLGYAAPAGLVPFGTDVFNRSDCSQQAKLRVTPRRATRGQQTVFRFRLSSPLTGCEQGTTIRFAGIRRRTNANGRARIVATLHHHAVPTKVARAFPANCPRAKAPVHVRSPR